MENAWLAIGVTVVAAVALFRLRQMMRWVPCEATFLGLAEQGLLGVTYTGQALPISFQLPDGVEVRASLRNRSRGALPRTGARLRIRYDPDDPERVEGATAVIWLAPLCAVLLVVLAAILRRTLRDAGFMV